MALRKRLTTNIAQTGDTCLMIAFNVIMNYYTNLGSDSLFRSFMETNDSLFTAYGIDRAPLNKLSLELQYEYLYKQIVLKTSGKVQFNNRHIAESFTKLVNDHFIITRIVDIKSEVENIKQILIQDEACLSLSLNGTFGWHATPIAYDNEFYTVHGGSYVALGQDFLNIKAVFQANDVGDGVLFQKSNQMQPENYSINHVNSQ